MLHYRCIISYIPNTELEIVSNSTEIFPVLKKLPSLFPVDAVTNAPANPKEALQNPAPYIPTPQIG